MLRSTLGWKTFTPVHDQTDMSNRPQERRNVASMSLLMRIFVGIFVAMLCFVIFIGGIGLLVEDRKKDRIRELDPDSMTAKWMMDLDDPAAVKEGCLIYIDPQADLPRPESVQHYKKTVSSHDPYADLAKEQLDALYELRSRNLTFIINVIGWSRRASLKRLLTSLENARYHGFTTRMHIHLDGDAHPLVAEFVEGYEWPHGKTAMNVHSTRQGLESTILHSWDGRNDNQLAFFFEDDIEVSPEYFEYTMLVLHKYIYNDPNGPRSESYLASKMMGIALNTPRFNEIVFPPYRWVPQHVIGQDDYQFAFQLANSWGCLYFPWVWREYRQYYKWRKHSDLGYTEQVIPDSYINQWVRSWKKSLIELSFFRGYYMIYPNLPGQHGFSIHHREPGEHTSLTGQPLVPQVDRMDDLYQDFFTVPLATNQRDINRLYATMKPLSELPVVNFYHERVTDIYQLVQDGAPAVMTLEKHGFDLEMYNPNPGCLLDSLSPPLLSAANEGEKFLVYQGQGSAYDQLVALENAFAYAKVLGRTLIIPPLTYENKAKKKFQQVTWQWLIDLKAFATKSPWAKFRLWEDTQDNSIWLDRMSEFRPPAKSGTSLWAFNDKLFDASGIVPMRSIVLPRIFGTSDGVLKSYGRCHDKYLGFRAMISTFKYHGDSNTERSFREWAQETLVLKDEFKTVYDEILQTIKRPYACLFFTRGDNPSNCGRGFEFASEELGKLVTYRNCNATAPRTIEYLMEIAQHNNVKLQTIFLYTDSGTPPVALPTFIDGGSIASGLKIPVKKRDFLTEIIRKRNVLHPDIKEMLPGIQAIFEDQLCTSSDVFLGNQFSEFALRVAQVRRSLGRNSNILGFESGAAINAV